MVNATDKCEPDALIRYLDDDLSPELRQEVDGHLRECAICRGELADLRRLLSLTDLPAPSSMNRFQAEAFAHRVRRGVRERYTRGSGWRRSWAASLGSAAAGAVALFLVLVAFDRLSPAGESGGRPPVEVSPTASPVAAGSAAESRITADDSGVVEVDSRSVESEAEAVELISDIDEFLMDTASDEELLDQMESLVQEEALLALLAEY